MIDVKDWEPYLTISKGIAMRRQATADHDRAIREEAEAPLREEIRKLQAAASEHANIVTKIRDEAGMNASELDRLQTLLRDGAWERRIFWLTFASLVVTAVGVTVALIMFLVTYVGADEVTINFGVAEMIAAIFGGIGAAAAGVGFAANKLRPNWPSPEVTPERRDASD